MKLDNRGWGYRDMIIYSCLILGCLLVATFYINRLYNELENSNNDNSSIVNNQQSVDNNENDTGKTDDDVVFDITYYHMLETKLYNATLNYVDNGKIDTSVDLNTVSSDILINNGYLNNFVDQKGNKCTGYSHVIKQNNDYNVKSYIYCNDYSTDN